LEYAKYAKYSRATRVKGLSETEDEIKPYHYVRTFKEVAKPKVVSEMDKEELQAYINQLLKPQDSIPENRSNQNNRF